HGLGPSDLDSLDHRAPLAHAELERRRASGGLEFWGLPEDASVVEPAASLGDELRERFENVVVLGIGGSSLGAKAVIAALGGPHHNLLPAAKRQGARVFFADNSDPSSFASLLDCIDLSSTCFLAITK